ncbi:MAG: peptidyl-prolyl cis-trans isomerase [Methylacidiphilales bacterium]|nr:peptidyl-prolyl cis-trans isomerase [Candidatus Methylacidiphilales bacterium]
MIIWAALLLFSGLSARAQDQEQEQQPILADGIAAVVNDKVITFLEINQQVAETEKMLRQNLQGDELFERLKEAKLNVLRALIERQLIIQDFKTKGGFIPDTYTNERINDIIREQYGGDRVAFVKTLYDRGVTMQKYREEIQNSAIVGYMRNKYVVQTVLVSPYQIEQYYQQNLRLFQQDEQVKVSTIVLRKSLFPSQKTGPDGKQISYDPQEEVAKEILYKLDTGSDFADLAKAYSEGSNKDSGGELGWVTQNGKTAINPELWPAIAKLQPGQHTDIVTTSDGYYYILQVEDRKVSTVSPLDDVRAQIEQTVINEESQHRQQQWLDSLRAKAFIKMNL